MAKVSLSNKQAHAFALAVYKDIKAYCETHKEDFELFLKEERERLKQTEQEVMSDEKCDF